MKISRAVELFTAISEPTRLRLLRTVIASKGELCNCELVDAVQESQPNVSRHLAVLVRAGVLRERRQGRWVYYGISADEPNVAAIAAVVRTLNDGALRDDTRRMKERLALRQDGFCVLGVQSKRLLSDAPSPRRVRAVRRRKEARR